jgi:hypothetical protein
MYREAAAELTEARLLWDTGSRLLLWPFYYLNPWLKAGRLNEFAAVDVLLTAAGIRSSSARLESSLGLDAFLRTGLWYLPSRAGLFAASETSRDGGVYAQTRSLRASLGMDIPLRGKGEAKASSADRLGLDAGYVIHLDYARKLRAHELSTCLDLQLADGLPGSLSGQHSLSWTRERQYLGDERLALVPGRPDLEPAVGEVPDRDTVTSSLSLEYRWEQSVKPRQRVSRWIPVPLDSTQTAAHTERLSVENQILITDRATTTSTGTIPLRIVLEHQTLMGVSENFKVALNLRTMGGLEERIEADQSFYEPAWGLEGRLEVIITF